MCFVKKGSMYWYSKRTEHWTAHNHNSGKRSPHGRPGVVDFIIIRKRVGKVYSVSLSTVGLQFPPVSPFHDIFTGSSNPPFFRIAITPPIFTIWLNRVENVSFERDVPLIYTWSYHMWMFEAATNLGSSASSCAMADNSTNQRLAFCTTCLKRATRPWHGNENRHKS